MIRQVTDRLTYGDCLPRPGYHQYACPTRHDLTRACACSVWWRGREYAAQWNELGATRVDDGPPYEETP